MEAGTGLGVKEQRGALVAGLLGSAGPVAPGEVIRQLGGNQGTGTESLTGDTQVGLRGLGRAGALVSE